jgi:L-ascorbate metabolism protein UlaG (beta-lactamase superfamily)
MRITWYGHAAFLIETEGLRIILDPYRSPDSGGYAPINDTADLVIVSHENDRYHSHLGQIVPPFGVLRALDLPPDGDEVCGIRFEAIHVFENAEARELARVKRAQTRDSETPPLEEDEVAVVHFRAEGLHLAFLGDLGHALDESELAPLRGADIVLVPAGGPPTIDLPEVPPLLDAIGPKLIFPMHYKTPGINLNIQPLERFLDVLPGLPVDRPGRSLYEICRATLSGERRIVVLEHAR